MAVEDPHGKLVVQLKYDMCFLSGIIKDGLTKTICMVQLVGDGFLIFGKNDCELIFLKLRQIIYSAKIKINGG